MPIRRDLAPLGIALALGVVVLVQLFRSGGAGRPATAQPGAAADPCQSLIAVPGADFMATPMAAQSSDRALAAISTRLAVSATNEGTLLLRPALIVEEPIHSTEDPTDVVAMLSAYFPVEEGVGTPDWRRLEELFLVDNPEDPDDIGLYSPMPSFAKQRQAAAAAIRQVGPAQIANATQVVFTGIADPVATPYGELKNAGANAFTPTERFVDDISGPPIIYASGNRVFVHVGQVEKRLEGGDLWAGGWKVKPASGDIQFSIRARPVNTVWNAEFCVDGLQVVSADPPPAAMDSNRLRWSFTPAASGSPIEVRVAAEPRRATWLRQWVSSGGRASIVLSWALLTPALLLVAGLWSARQTGASTPQVEEARARLNGASTAVVKLAAAGVMVLLLRATEPTVDPELGYRVRSLWRDILVLGLSVIFISFEFVGSWLLRNCRPRWRGLTGIVAFAFIVAIACVVIVAAFVNRPYGWDAIWSPLERSLLVAGYFTFFATAVAMWKTPLFTEFASWRVRFLVGMGVGGLMLCAYDLFGMQSLGIADWVDDAVAILTPLWVTSCVVIGFVLLTAALLPMQLTHLENTPVGQFHAILAIVIVLGAILIQWAAALYGQQPFPARALLETDPPLHLHQVYADEMQADVAKYLEAFLGPALNLLPLLGLAGLIGMLYAAALSKDAMHQSADLTWIERVLRFLFAAFVIGYGGSVLGLRAPVAFLIGLVLLPLAWNARADASPISAGDKVALVNGVACSARSAAPSGRRKARSNGARPRARVATISKAATASTSIAKHTGTREIHHVRRSAPADRGNDAARTEAQVAEWWKNGALSARLGSGLAIAPVAFFIYVFVTDPNAGAWSSGSPFAMATFVSAVAYEVAFWLVAAFVFGCLFPYLRGENGLIKGLVLAAVYVGANATAAIVGVSGDALWKVRSFQLIVFLILLGVWIDRISLPDKQQSWHGLWDRYELGNATAWIKHVLPFASALAAIAIQLYQNNTQEAITALIQGQTHDEILKFACLVAGSPGC